MTSIVERVKRFLWMATVGYEPSAPPNRSYESAVNKHNLMNGKITLTEWCRLEGIELPRKTEMVRPKAALSVKEPPKFRKKQAKTSSVANEVRVAITEKDILERWKQRISSLTESDLASATDLNLDKLVAISERLKRFSDEPLSKARLGLVGLTEADTILLRAIRCADKNSFEIIDPESVLPEGALSETIDISIKYLRTYPKIQNVRSLFKAVWAKRGPR